MEKTHDIEAKKKNYEKNCDKKMHFIISSISLLLEMIGQLKDDICKFKLLWSIALKMTYVF